jgi:hypothetical protein
MGIRRGLAGRARSRCSWRTIELRYAALKGAGSDLPLEFPNLQASLRPLVAPAVLPPVSCARLTIATLRDTQPSRFLPDFAQRMRSLRRVAFRWVRQYARVWESALVDGAGARSEILVVASWSAQTITSTGRRLSSKWSGSVLANCCDRRVTGEISREPLGGAVPWGSTIVRVARVSSIAPARRFAGAAGIRSRCCESLDQAFNNHRNAGCRRSIYQSDEVQSAPGL